MTFTILGYCRNTQKAGFCQATSTPAVGWRCTDVVFGRGLVTVQAHGDFRQLQLAKRLMEFGHSPAKVMKDLSEDDKYFDFRQIAILDLHGNSAVNTGARARPWAGEIVGADHVVTGNVLVGEKVVRAMSKAYEGSAGQELEERLLKAVEAGRDAGGQEEGQTSCALVVYEKHTFPIVNLRVDVALEPIGEMRKILDWYKPLIPYYISRTLDPTSVSPKKAMLEKMGLPVNPYATLIAMTFCIIAREPKTGLLGLCQATNPLSVGGRCPFIRSNVGAVSTQAYTDPGLGPAGHRAAHAGLLPGEGAQGTRRK